VDKCRSIPGFSTSSMHRCLREGRPEGRSGFPRAVGVQISASGAACLSVRRACSRALMRFLDLPVKIKQIVVELGFRGVDADNPDMGIIHRGKIKSLSRHQKTWLRRRQAVEPAIGHLKSDHRMERCWLQGAVGDALHAVSCAAGFNLRWLLRAIADLQAAATARMHAQV